MNTPSPRPAKGRHEDFRLLKHPEDLVRAANLAAAAHQRLRARHPFLPPRDPGHYQPRIAWMADHGQVMGLFRDGVLESFLGGFILDNFRNAGRGAFCPDWCQGAAEGVSSFQACRHLYRELAPLWRKQGAFLHSVAVYATETEVLEALSLTGFGRIVMDAARPVEELLGALGTSTSPVPARRATLEDALILAGFEAELAAHIGASPVLMPDTRSRSAAQWETWLQEPDAFASLSGRPESATGFIKAQSAQFDVTDAVHASISMAINGMFVEPASRGTGTAQDLLRHLVQEAHGKGIPMLSVDCETHNLEAFGFWTRYFHPITWTLERRT